MQEKIMKLLSLNYLKEAESAYQTGAIERALDYYQRAIQLDPKLEITVDKTKLFFQTAQYGYLSLMQWLVSQGVNVLTTVAAEDETLYGNLKIKYVGLYALHIAALNGQTDVVKYFIEVLKQDVDVLDAKDGWTPLMRAAKHGQLETAQYLVGQGAKVDQADNEGDQADNEGDQALHLAAFNGQTAVVEYFIEVLKQDVNVADVKDGYTPLMYAANNGHLETVQYLRSKGAKCDQATNKGNQALHLAAFNGQTAVVEYFIEVLKQDVNVVNAKNGWTPLMCAAQYGHLETVKYLRSKGAKCDQATNEGNQALHLAALTGQTAVVEYLVGQGAQIDQANGQGNHALHLAAWQGHLPIVQYLVGGKNVRIEQANNDGFQALHLAAWSGRTAIVTYFIEVLKQDVDVLNAKVGWTPLMYAAENGHLAIVQYLIAQGADPSLKNQDNEKALDVATGAVKDYLKSLSENAGFDNAKPPAEAATALVTTSSNLSNKATEKFLEQPSHLEFRTWYHPEICQYLLQLSDNNSGCIRVVFADADYGNNTQTFKKQLQELLMLANVFNRSALFISKEPGADNHFVCGLLKANRLLLINPRGITNQVNCYQTLAELQKDKVLANIWLASNPLQKHIYEEEGLVSCGPISMEIALHCLQNFNAENLAKWLDDLKTEESTKDEKSGLNYYGTNIDELLPQSLRELKNASTEETYQAKVCELRQQHYQYLQKLPAEKAQAVNLSVDDYLNCLCNAPSQVLFNLLMTGEATINNLSEKPEYELLVQELEKKLVNKPIVQKSANLVLANSPQTQVTQPVADQSLKVVNVDPLNTEKSQSKRLPAEFLNWLKRENKFKDIPEQDISLVMFWEEKIQNIINGLLQMLEDDKASVRAESARILGWLGESLKNLSEGQQTIVLNKLMETVCDEEKSVSNEAVVALSQQGKFLKNVNVEQQKTVLGMLLQALKDKEGPGHRLVVELGLFNEFLGTVSADQQKEVLDILLQALRDRECHVRENAAGALGQLGVFLKTVNTEQQTVIVHALVQVVLEDEITSISIQAAVVLGQLGECLQTVSVEQQAAVLHRLLLALEDKEYKIIEGSRKALGQLGVFLRAVSAEQQAAVLDTLVRTLRGRESPYLVVGQFSQLGELLQIGSAKQQEIAVELLVKAIWDKEGFVPNTAVQVLSQLGEFLKTVSADQQKAVLDMLILALEDEAWGVRYSAVTALGKLDEFLKTVGTEQQKVVLDKLVQMALEDKKTSVRKVSVVVLGELYEFLKTVGTGQQKVVMDKLVQVALEDQKAFVRTQAAVVLGQYGKFLKTMSTEQQKAVVDKLLHALEDKKWVVRSNAVKALGQLGGFLLIVSAEQQTVILGKLVQAALEDKVDSVCTEAAAALGQLCEFLKAVNTKQQNAVLDKLLRSLHDKDSKVGYLVEVLGQLGEFLKTVGVEQQNAVLDILVEALQYNGGFVSSAAVSALGQLSEFLKIISTEQQNAVLDKLLQWLEDKNQPVRFKVVQTLGQLDKFLAAVSSVQQKAVLDKLLQKLFSDENPSVRYQVGWTLKKILLTNQTPIMQAYLEWKQLESNRHTLFWQHFLQQAQTNPTACAIEYQLPGQAKFSLTYQELISSVYQFARFLQQNNLQKGDANLVALYLPKTEQVLERIVSILALLFLGVPYAPMDQERFADVMKSGAKFLLTDKSSFQELQAENIALLDIAEFNNQLHEFSIEPMQTEVTPEDLAYVIYTSGSTGASKGVAIKHLGLPNVFTSIQDVIQLKPGDKVAQITSLGFDASLCEIMMALGAGASLVLIPNEYRKDLPRLTQYYQEHNVTAAIFVPSVLHELDEQAFPQVNKILITGEGFKVDLVQRWQPATRTIINGYGPTETTIGASVIRLTPELLAQNLLSIGYPMRGINVYLWDEDHQQLLEPWKDHIDENRRYDLYIGGENLMREYWQRQNLTAKALREIMVNGEKIIMYVSGDTVAFKNGHLHDVKRSNRMLKISGKRVDLDGFDSVIYKALKETAELKSVAVVALNERAVAYLVGNPALFKLPEFIAHLKLELPDVYMCLKSLVWMDELPKLNISGKIDYKKLATAEYFEQQAKTIGKVIALEFNKLVTPRFTLEKTLAVLWCEELGIELTAKFSIYTCFAELGGTSFNIPKLLNRVQKLIGQEILWSNILKNPAKITLAALTTFLLQQCLIVTLKAGKSTREYPGIYCIHSAAGDAEIDYKNTLLKQLPTTPATVFGLQAEFVTAKNISIEDLQDLAAHYIAAIKSQQPQGPYCLVGWSSGGVIAYEMAQQLIQQGDSVFINIIDSLHPACSGEINKLLKNDENKEKLDKLMKYELAKKIIAMVSAYEAPACKSSPLLQLFIQGVDDLGWKLPQITIQNCNHFSILEVPNLLADYLQAIQKYLQINPYLPAGHVEFMEALKLGHTRQLEHLIKAENIDVNVEHPIYGSYLHWAVIYNQPNMMEWLLSQGADIEAENDAKQRPLGLALLQQDSALIKELLRHGASPFGMNFIMLADVLKFTDAEKLKIKQAGGFIELGDLFNPLQFANALRQHAYQKHRLQALTDLIQAWQQNKWCCDALNQHALVQLNDLRTSDVEINKNIQAYASRKAENYFTTWLSGKLADGELNQQACLLLITAWRNNQLSAELAEQLTAARQALLLKQAQVENIQSVNDHFAVKALENLEVINQIKPLKLILKEKIERLCNEDIVADSRFEIKQAFTELLVQWQQNYFIVDSQEFLPLLVGFLMDYQLEHALREELEKQAVVWILQQLHSGQLLNTSYQQEIQTILQAQLVDYLQNQWQEKILQDLIADWQANQLSHAEELVQQLNIYLPQELLILQQEILYELYAQNDLIRLNELRSGLPVLHANIESMRNRLAELETLLAEKLANIDELAAKRHFNK